MAPVARNPITGMRASGSRHLASLRKGSISLIPLRGESPPSTKSGSTEEAPMPSIDPTVAVDAIRLVDEDRNDSYGPPEENLSRIAAMGEAS